MSKTIVKQITFPKELLKFLERKSKEYGYTLPGYVRYVLTKEMEKERYKEKILIEEGLISDIKEGDKDFEEGKTVTLNSIKEIEDYFASIADEENKV